MGIPQLLLSSLVAGVLTVISDKTAHLRLSCQSVCRDLMCTDPEWFATALEFLRPWIEENVWVLDYHRRSTHFYVMKCDCDALSSSALHCIYEPGLFWIPNIAVDIILDFLICPWMNNICFFLEPSTTGSDPVLPSSKHNRFFYTFAVPCVWFRMVIDCFSAMWKAFGLPWIFLVVFDFHWDNLLLGYIKYTSGFFLAVRDQGQDAPTIVNQLREGYIDVRNML